MIRSAKLSDAHEIANVHVKTWKSAYRDIVPNPYLKSLSTEAREDYWSQTMLRLVVRVFDTVTLWVLVENRRAMEFYRKAGLKPEPESIKEIEITGKILEENRYKTNIG